MAMLDSSHPQEEPSDRAITVTVERIFPAGLIVRLPDGREGLIRERELTWQVDERRGCRERYKPGDRLSAVLLDHSQEGRKELSVRLAAFNPWTEVGKRFPIGSLVAGIVTGIMPYGVFIEIAPGVIGLVHTSRLPDLSGRTVGDLFWLGDHVMATVETIDSTQRRMTLGMSSLTDYRWQHLDVQHDQRLKNWNSLFHATRSSASFDDARIRSSKAVLIVEDDVEQQRALAGWLDSVGHICHVVPSAEEAMRVVARDEPDLLLMDVGLPGINGIEAAHVFRSRFPRMRCFLMTDWTRAEQHSDELGQLGRRGVLLLMKPLLPEDLLYALAESDKISDSLPALESSSQVEHEPPSPKLNLAKHTLHGLLARLRAAVRADSAILFEVNPASRRVEVVEQYGTLALHRWALPELIHSPVRDVAEEEREVVAADWEALSNPRFRHLVPLLDFQACVGVPVPASLQTTYALFVFYARPIASPENVRAYTRATGAAVGAWLEQRQFAGQAADLQRVALLGQLSRALIHEISGRLTPIGLALEGLQYRIDAIERSTTNSPARVWAETRHARAELQSLMQQTQALTRTTRSFSHMIRSGQEEILQLANVVEEAIEILQDTAARAHVEIRLYSMPKMLFMRAQVTSLQQVIVNVLQNAIQQIAMARPLGAGRVEIRLAQTSSEGVSMLQISIEDDGPGIHGRLWERIFDLDFTTRPDGSGLGLYLSRNLMEAQGGRIYLEDSHVLWGSTFVVELPYRL